MKKTRETTTTEITIEQEEFFSIRANALTRICCSQCPTEPPMITAEAAAEVTGLSLPEIYRWADEGRIHSTLTPAGLLMICPNSVSVNLHDGEFTATRS